MTNGARRTGFCVAPLTEGKTKEKRDMKRNGIGRERKQ
jgi:hypothetical protein